MDILTLIRNYFTNENKNTSIAQWPKRTGYPLNRVYAKIKGRR